MFCCGPLPRLPLSGPRGEFDHSNAPLERLRQNPPPPDPSRRALSGGARGRPRDSSVRSHSRVIFQRVAVSCSCSVSVLTACPRAGLAAGQTSSDVEMGAAMLGPAADEEEGGAAAADPEARQRPVDCGGGGGGGR